MIMLRVSRQSDGNPEIFYSLQGEGVTQGTPTVFLRLATCNLTCTWCDTKYTWDWKAFSYDQQVMPLPADEVERRILEYECPHLVITGGEPMMQQRQLVPLVQSLKERGFYIEVETNGTLAPQPEIVEAVSQWNVSPKLSNSGVDPVRREVAPALTAFRELDAAYFKFVIAETDDVDEACAMIARHSLPIDRVILMPEGTTVEAIQERGKFVAQACAEKGFRFSTRMHILLWGDERGR